MEKLIATDKDYGSRKVTYSETFFSPQGEGHYNGAPTVWLRFFLCNLQCEGFGQEDPTNPDTYDLPYKDLDVSQYTSVEQLPVFDRGCDSSYSWHKRYRHLAKQKPVRDVVRELEGLMHSPSNPYATFQGGVFRSDIHLCFTGGEPMLNQDAICDILLHLEGLGNLPKHVTFETNGTKAPTEQMMDTLSRLSFSYGTEFFMSFSPKLFNTSGEPNKRAIKPDVISQWHKISHVGQLKFVVNGTDDTWEELGQVLGQIGPLYPVWIMPVGATKESQETPTVAKIANETIKRGFNVCARSHTTWFGNQIGT